jgi:hypothetical protein
VHFPFVACSGSLAGTVESAIQFGEAGEKTGIVREWRARVA